jgi:hypothetical protein
MLVKIIVSNRIANNNKQNKLELKQIKLELKKIFVFKLLRL